MKIRHASTVILARKNSLTDPSFQIYLMKRPKTMQTFQSYTVFPGGMLEAQDERPEWKHYFHNCINTHLLLPERSDSPVRAFSESNQGQIPELPYVVAAIREVFEETGILLCQWNRESQAVKFQSGHDPALRNYRKALLTKELTFLEMVKQLDLQFDAAQLTYIGRRVTPPPKSFCFDANVYLTIVPAGAVSAPSREAVSDEWLEPAVALQLARQREIVCAPATIECFVALQSLEKPIETLWD
ncbi:hypothetical protein [Ammoniphilus oxalaticus]|uniref:hypothetical protein n=1 Tax=Ammoniphilus oxalaticus TaxID=66863 RepID=UPI000E7281C5|nr:hypothetical protein [Ammoniphilus oxalaticus]